MQIPLKKELQIELPLQIRGVHSAPTAVTLKVDGESEQSLGGWKYDKKMQVRRRRGVG